MRWLKEPEARAEHGAVSVLVALLMVILLGFAALAVDIGMVVSEKAQLQNGADAGALAIAQECARDLDDIDCLPTAPIARSLANSNALDTKSNVKNVIVDKTARKVTVTTGALQDGQAPNRISLLFANVLGISSSEVTASSTATWGSPTSGPAPFPITFSECELKDGPGWQVVEFRKKSDATPACAGGPPGGFGSLNQVPGKCEAFVDIAHSASGSNTGNTGAPHDCVPLLQEWRTKIEAGEAPVGLFPIYRSVSDSGNNAIYQLIGFAAFEVHGWKFKQEGNSTFPDSFRDNYYAGYKCSSTQCIGIIGKFVKMVGLDSAYTLGPYNPDMGAVVRLTLEEATP
ncbi:pilus assembly protein TadG-related protein [Arthrobacter ruber]|uniref:pilus assembly protein TadG-related protein n=1 Tax=Arthrobacter ruber TaxID=1258893 RepID=UPI001F0C6CE5|nr:TadE/TadG family type IV pilus assembly protein [Arthrobacter ruber]